jgi:hypothetical protein
MTLLAEVVSAVEPAVARHGVAEPAAGRFEGHDHAALRPFVLEAVYEGYLLHYAQPRAFEGMDEDLRLLAGDALYALGLSRLAEAGDLEAVGKLADLISGSAQAHAEGLPEEAERLWTESAAALLNAPDR